MHILVIFTSEREQFEIFRSFSKVNVYIFRGSNSAIFIFCLPSYRKNSKIWDTSNNCHNCPKNRNVCCNIALMHPKDADGMANSIDPDQTASSEAV